LRERNYQERGRLLQSYSLEPMVSLEVAVELIPMTSRAALYQFLHHHKSEIPRHYKRIGWREVRMLTMSEIQKIRDMTIKSTGRYTERAPSPGRPRKLSREQKEPISYNTLFNRKVPVNGYQ